MEGKGLGETTSVGRRKTTKKGKGEFFSFLILLLYVPCLLDQFSNTLKTNPQKISIFLPSETKERRERKFTDIVSFELINSYEYTSGTQPQKPFRQITHDWEFSRMKVISPNIVETLLLKTRTRSFTSIISHFIKKIKRESKYFLTM